jgi:hypothetical protein
MAIIIKDRLMNGPWMIIVEPENSANEDKEKEIYPFVIAPPEGFASKKDAIKYVEDNFANRKTPYLNLTFTIVAWRSPSEFIAFCSWED